MKAEQLLVASRAVEEPINVYVVALKRNKIYLFILFIDKKVNVGYAEDIPESREQEHIMSYHYQVDHEQKQLYLTDYSRVVRTV